jgi:hypothetical protein
MTIIQNLVIYPNLEKNWGIPFKQIDNGTILKKGKCRQKKFEKCFQKVDLSELFSKKVDRVHCILLLLSSTFGNKEKK